MSGSIGSMLASFGRDAMEATLAAAGRTATPSETSGNFGAQLEASFQARAERLGLTLSPSAAATTSPPSSAETVDQIWKRAQMLSVAAGNGPGDAMMQSLSDAADARWARERSGDAPDIFDL